MVSSADLVAAPTSGNQYIKALTGDYIYRPGYQITYVLQGSAGDKSPMGGSLWAQAGAAQAFQAAAQAWMAVANVSIKAASTGYDGTGDRSAYTWVESLKDLGSDDTGTTLGEHTLPGPYNQNGEFNNAIPLWTAANNAVGGYSFVTFLHEMGHGLGLTHPFEDGNSFPGVSGSDDTGDNGLNQGIFTVMSYNDGYAGAMSPSDAYGWSGTPMAFDIAAIQNLYGANMTTATSDNVYHLPGSNGAGTYWSCIWDAAGVDTISATGLTANCTIDLRAATLDDAPGGGGWLSEAGSVYGGFTIAHNVVIENAAGGAGDDNIQGNDVANIITGGGGNDTIHGAGGNDNITANGQLFGEAGNDWLHGNGSLDGGDGDDVLIGGDGHAAIIGGAGNDQLFGAALGGDLHGGDGNDVLVGGAGNDNFYGDGGHDVFYGGAGDDSYYVDATDELVFEAAGGGNDTVHSSASYYLYDGIETLWLDAGASFGVGNALDNHLYGNDAANLLLGGGGNDTMAGQGGNDSMFGEAGDDHVSGGAGIDYIAGGAGNDILVGDQGADALYGEDGDDILIADSEPSDPYAGASATPPVIDFVTDTLVGGAGNDILHGDSGKGDYDLLDGGTGNDTYYVDTPADLTFEATNGGTDTVIANIKGAGYYLYANVENLVLTGNTPFGVGNELDNHLTGNDIANYLLGGAGNDILNGKGGNDVLFGEAGADTFVFEHGTGGDVVGDFVPGTDHIDLSAIGYTSFAQVQGAMHENGGNTAIDLGNGDLIVLNCVTATQLHAGDFILATAAPVAVVHDVAPIHEVAAVADPATIAAAHLAIL